MRRLFVLLVSFLFVFSFSTAPAVAVVDARPNIVIVNADDMRRDDAIHMPKMLSWMRAGGTEFTNAYVPTPTCCPSRAVLMSGRYVHNNEQFDQNQHGFYPGASTIQGWLQASGYQTGVAGKFLNWWNLSEKPPFWTDLDIFRKGYSNVTVNSGGTTSKSGKYTTDIVFDAAEKYINNFSSPFYLYLNPYAPHLPATPTQKYAAAPVPARAKVPSHGEPDASDKPSWIRESSATYDSATSTYKDRVRTLMTLDDRFDAMMNLLQSSGKLSNTMVVFTSDNGFLLGEHRQTKKFLPYEESINIPLFVRWPGHLTAGAKDGRLVANVDFVPTFLDAAGISTANKNLDGQSFLGTASRKIAFIEYYKDNIIPGIPRWAGLKTNNYVYVEYYNGTTILFREYYNMQNDPYQLTNLLKDGNSANDPDVTVLHQVLDSFNSCQGQECRDLSN